MKAKVNELQMEVYPALVELASNISTLNLEHVRRYEAHASGELEDNLDEEFKSSGLVSKFAPVSPVGSASGYFEKLQRAFSSVVGSHRNLLSFSSSSENIDQLEILFRCS
ncbi:hypothetical protein F2Q69_00028248 [Brassica cretica]|uniref:Uncharacterized protein n=1 Tax=Brassica cretica TaxID=69181 RepID=A0A8S9RU82_BRACR|nr:hypothetical protein F2Q69_00028248 [Brassica cretica]